jgi:hypothetical protein
MKTTYAPKFPDIKNAYDSAFSGPLVDYHKLIAMRNAKVSKLNYGK